MTRAAEYLSEEIAMLKELVAAKEVELAAMIATPVAALEAAPIAALEAAPVAALEAAPIAAPVAVSDEPPAKRRKLSHDPPAGLKSYVYRFGVRIPKKVPKAKTFGVVTTLRETMYDHVSIKDGQLYLMIAGEAYPKTDVQVKHVVRSSKRPDADKPRLFPMLDIYNKGIRVGTVRSKADLLRRLGVDLPTVYSCCKVVV